MVVFRKAIEDIQAAFLPGGLVGNYEAMSAGGRFALVVLGGLTIGIILQRLPASMRPVGILHVIESLRQAKGRLPWANAAWQFCGAVLAIVSGQSIDREGPSVHLGAASSHLVGDWLGLPRSSVRVLASCGVAAAIAASFNTPLAGVVFSMEVVTAEYSVSGFIPVILAAVSATLVMQNFYGTTPAFSLPDMGHYGSVDLPATILLGIVIGLFATLFIRLVDLTARQGEALPIVIRPLVASIVTGLLAIWLPQIMGMGYDSVQHMLAGQPGLMLLIALVCAKLITTALSVGLGYIPAGFIGPALFMGAAAGGIAGHLQSMWSHTEVEPAFYVVMGMGAMMGAILQAPLAALTAMLELTGMSSIILPGMLTIITAVLTSKEFLHCPSIFSMLLRDRGLDAGRLRLGRYLRSVAISQLMDQRIMTLTSATTPAEVRQRLSASPVPWVILSDEHGAPAGWLPGTELRSALDTTQPVTITELSWRPLQTIDIRSDASEALEVMELAGVDLLCIVMKTAGELEIAGIVTRIALRSYYGG